jgi:hypothetical protein
MCGSEKWEGAGIKISAQIHFLNQRDVWQLIFEIKEIGGNKRAGKLNKDFADKDCELQTSTKKITA